MKRKCKLMPYWVLLAITPLILTGCYAAVAYAPSLLQSGISAIAGMENVDLNFSMSPGITKEDLKKIKRIGIVLGASQTQANSQATTIKWGDDLTNVMADNIALELMKLGFEVIERGSLDKVLSEQKLQMSGLTDPATAANVGKILGVDAVVLGNVTTSQKMQTSSGFMGVGAGVTTTSVISNATMKIVGIEQGKVLTMVALSYKKGQNPTEAAKTMAVALSKIIKGEVEPQSK
jgi:curli biogenesis system outer membrane secretion channel CsgG